MSAVVSLSIEREQGLARAGGALRAGELIVAPTDTVYGIGADAFNREATARIFDVKQRPRSLPLPVLVSRPKQAWALTSEVPPGAVDLVAGFWPGALTLVLPEADLDWDLGDTAGGVAIRMPDHPDLLTLLERTGPMAMTSANVTGEPTPRNIDEIVQRFGESVGLYLDGGPSPADAGSTIVDLSRGEPLLVREGPIEIERLEAVLRGPVARS